MVRTVLLDGERWFVGTDVLKALNYSQSVTGITQAVVTNLGSQHVRSHPVPDKIGRNQLTLLLSEKALKYTLQQSRKPKAKALAMELNLDLDIMQSPIETETIRIIQAAFKTYNPIDQFFVAGYRIDLYFPKERIAVECDEPHHNTPAQQAEDADRCLQITELLGCKWVRYNPTTPNFNIGDVISTILLFIQNDKL